MKTAVKRAAVKGTAKQAIVKKGKFATKVKKNVPRNLTSVNLGLGFPKRVVCTHKYVGFRDLTSTTGLVGTYRFSCNGMFDPDSTGVGHQPMYFDNLTAIYDHYTVIGSKLTLKVVPKNVTQGPGAVAVFVNDDTSTVITNIGTAVEQSSGTSALLLPVGQSVPLTVTKYWSAKKTFGGSILGNDNLQGNASADPTESQFYDICYQDIGTGSATSTVQLWVEIEYTAVWDELRDQAQQ